VIDELVVEYVDDEDQLSDQEQAAAVIERYQSQIRGDQSGDSQSKYYDLDPVPIANTGPFGRTGRTGRARIPSTGRRRLTTIPGGRQGQHELRCG